MLHIHYLLQHYNWVVLPGIGAFINEYHPSAYDAASRTWIPSRHKISFANGQYPDDYLLLKSYLRREADTKAEAQKMIDAAIKELLLSVKENRKVIFPNFGTLSQSSIGQLHFTPEKSPIEENRALGFRRICINEPVETGIDCKNGKSIVARNGEEIRTRFSSVKYIFRSVACMLVLIVSALSFVSPTEVCWEKITNLGSLATISSESEVVDNEIGMNNETLKQAKEVSCLAKPEPDMLAQDKGKAKYYLIVGTFSNEAEAQKYISGMGDDAGKLTSLPTSTLCRVACASADNVAELQKRLNSKEFRSLHSDAWIWHAKK